MSVSTIKTRLADICKDITGIKNAYAQVQRNIAGADLPAVVVLTGEATNTLAGNDLGREERQYRLALLVMPNAQGVEGEAEQLTDPFYDRFRVEFGDRPGLWLTTEPNALRGVQDAWKTSDTGLTSITLANVEYVGAIFTINVVEIYDLKGRGY